VTKPGKFDALREKEFEARASFDMKSLHSDFGPKIFVQETYPRPSVQAHWKGDDDGMLRTTKRAWERSWPEDVADSLYRQARELLNRGEWRRAIAIFKDISQRYPNSAYVPDAMYWQAFSLYRIGGSTELREALTILETQRTRFPGSRTLADAATLSTRIRGALASRGDAAAAAQIARTASDSTQRCDQEELAVRVEALSALTQSDPDGASTILQRVLARRDECSVPLRRNAVFLIGGKRRDASAGATLIRVAKSDPSTEVRVAAIEWLSRIADDNALTALEELARSDSDNVQRAAVRALVVYPGPRARQHVRSIIERNDVPERLRSEALAAFDKERSDADDIAWLRAFYGRTDNIRLKQRVVSTLSRIGGTEVDQWLLSLARNNDESSEIRSVALRRVSQTLPIADVSRLYDASAERSVREELINALSNRTEAESTDKLIDIVKTGTDPQLRRQAISALTRKKDPRTTRLLMELLDK
jgi:HEAT repeat protein